MMSQRNPTRRSWSIRLVVGLVGLATRLLAASHHPLAADTEAPSIIVKGSNITLNGKSIQLPVSRADLVAILGEPSRAENGATSLILTWDKLGLYAHFNQDRGGVHSISAVFVPGVGSYSPKSMFSGTVTVDGAAVKVSTSPEDINSKKSDQKFEKTRLPTMWELRYQKKLVMFLELPTGRNAPPDAALGRFTLALPID